MVSHAFIILAWDVGRDYCHVTYYLYVQLFTLIRPILGYCFAVCVRMGVVGHEVVKSDRFLRFLKHNTFEV